MVAVSRVAPDAQVKVLARNPKTRAELISLAKSLGLNAGKTAGLTRAAKWADLTIATLPGGALNDAAAKLAKKNSFLPGGAILDVAYQPWPSSIASVWHQAGRPIISGLEMLLWQAVAQIRIFTNGDANEPLANEVAVVEAMRHSLD
jgi:shikimate dehydrogenase